LIPSVLRRFNQTDITGAFIVDTMMAFNEVIIYFHKIIVKILTDAGNL